MTVLSSDPRTLSREAYIYLYPLALMEATRRLAVHGPDAGNPMAVAPNAFRHLRAFPTADFRAVVRPNFDTLYSAAWLDLTRGPVRIHIPDSGGRYYLLPMLDMWTDVFATPGKRTTGTGAQDIVVTLTGTSAPIPPGSTVISAPTPHVWIIGRTQTNGPSDYADVAAFQDGLSITPLGEPVQRVADPTVTTTDPMALIGAMTGVEFFSYAASALAENGPHLTDHAQLARIAAIGIVPGQAFDPGRIGPGQLADIEAGVAAARADMVAGIARTGVVVDGWSTLTEDIGVYGNDYLRRAVIALAGLGANPAEDAVYPLLHTDADGAPMHGDHDYVVHFAADALPPVSAFWSITMYDDEGFQVANTLDRFAIGDRDPLVFNADGSLDIHIQHTDPGPGKTANWLPAPRGPLGITMRLYAPGAAVLDGSWSPPPVRKVPAAHD